MNYRLTLAKIKQKIAWVANEYGANWKEWNDLFTTCQNALEKVIHYESHKIEEDSLPSIGEKVLVLVDAASPERHYQDCTAIGMYTVKGWILIDLPDVEMFEIKKWRYMPDWSE